MNERLPSQKNIDQIPFPKKAYLDAHTLILDGKEYDVYKLIDITSHISPTHIDLEKIKDQILEEECWNDAKKNTFSPKNLLDAYNESGSWEHLKKAHPEWMDHIRKTENADYNYPILMLDNEVIDGMHRLIKAITDNVPDIPVRIIDHLPEEAIYSKD